MRACYHRSRGALGIAAAVVLGGASLAEARTLEWVTNNVWSNPNSWSPAGPPTSGDIVTFSGGGNLVTLDGPAFALGVTVPQASVTFNLGDHTLQTMRGLYLAESSLHTATLNVSATTGKIVSDDFISIGHYGNGTLNQTGGTIATSDSAAVGFVGTGTLNVSGGTFEASRVYVGGLVSDTGEGTINVTGSGILKTTIGSIVIGTTSNRGGVVTVADDGQVLADGNNIEVASGHGMPGTLTQTGGTVRAGHTLHVGLGQFSSGLYEMQGGAATVGSLHVGYANGTSDGRGVFTMTGGSMNASAVRLFNSSNGSSESNRSKINFSGGTLTTGTLTVDSNWTERRFNWTGGTLNITGMNVNLDTMLQIQIIGPGQTLNLPNGHDLDLSTSSNAHLGGFLYGGAINLTGGFEYIGGSGQVGVDHMAGSNAARRLYLGSAAGSNGTYTQSGGTLSLTEGVFVAMGAGSAGTFTLSGGSVTTPGVAVGSGGVFSQTGGTINTGAFEIAAGRAATVSSVSTEGFSNLLRKTGPGTLVLSNANAYAGTIDLVDGNLIHKSSSGAAVRAQIVSGYNNGDWLGGGITSSTAANDPTGLTAIGYFDNAEFGATSFEGVSGLDSDDVIVKYTYYGDADLNGMVDPDDFNAFLSGFQDSNLPRTWLYGDFDYNNVIDPDDFNLFLAAFQANGAPLSELVQTIEMSSLSASDQQLLLGAVAAVPEPATMSLVAIGAGLTLLRRRRA